MSDAFLSDIFHRQVQPLVLQALGFQVLHASAALVQDRVVVLAGFAHSGKSTLAHAIGRAGYRQFADDSVVIDAGRRPVLAHALSFSSRLRQPSRTFFEAPDARADVNAELAGAIRPLAAIVLLTQSSSASVPHLRRLGAADALRMTMLHANGFDSVTAAERRRTLADYLTITQAVPVFDLTYRPNFAELPALVSTVVETAAEPAEARP